MTLAQVPCMYLCDFLHAIMTMRGREKGVLCVYSRLFREKVGLRSSAGTRLAVEDISILLLISICILKDDARYRNLAIDILESCFIYMIDITVTTRTIFIAGNHVYTQSIFLRNRPKEFCLIFGKRWDSFFPKCK